jgi:hypothetical protein
MKRSSCFLAPALAYPHYTAGKAVLITGAGG